MPLDPGTRLGPYEISTQLGVGGMGEVYRATDTNLKRQVAIKVLPGAVAGDAERLARFQREAEVLAALNHPNIAQIHGLEKSDGTIALVMELVEGPTLADRIAAGPMGVDEALPIAKQIAEALEAAHDQGIVHRDLKPANVKLRPDGTVKVLDFGLAKAMEPTGAMSSSASMAPTITTPAMTQAGIILGTAAYMSPEQAVGKPVDKRSDLWAFGVVLLEMLTGRQAFKGETVSHVLASVLKDEPDWAALPSDTPAALRRLLSRCLQKDRRQRLADAADARLEIEDAQSSPVAAAVGQAEARPRSRLAWGVAAVLALIGMASGYGWWRATRPVERPLTRLSVDLGPDATAEVVRGSGMPALSPDGTRIAFMGLADPGSGDPIRRVFVRRLDQAVATPLTGNGLLTPSTPFFSPDGEWIGFLASGTVMKVSAQGGSPVTVGEVSDCCYDGAAWGDDGNIIVGSIRGLMRLPAAGGVAQPLVDTAVPQSRPDVLPGARAVLFDDNLGIEVLVFGTGETRMLIPGGRAPHYLPSNGSTGHLVFRLGRTLLGVAFDPDRLEVLSEARPVVDDVAASPEGFSSSRSGTSLYLSGQSTAYRTLWLDPSGQTTPLIAQPGTYGTPRLSPDGTRLAYTAEGAGGTGDVWVYDLERDTPTQLTFNGPGLRELVWAPDSRHLAYGDATSLWWMRADGSGEPQRLLDGVDQPRPSSFAPDGRLAFSPVPNGVPDVWTLPLDLSDPDRPVPGTAEPFLTTPGVEVDGAFSPDGKFLAYASNESGSEDVYVRAFPGPGGKWKISTAGGKFPAWSRAGRELFFLGGDDRIMVVSYTTQGDALMAGRPRAWSSTLIRRTNVYQSFDVAPDGTRIVMFEAPATGETRGSLHVTFLLNFFDELRRRIPTP